MFKVPWAVECVEENIETMPSGTVIKDVCIVVTIVIRIVIITIVVKSLFSGRR